MPQRCGRQSIRLDVITLSDVTSASIGRCVAVAIVTAMMGAWSSKAFSRPACLKLVSGGVSADAVQLLARGVNLAGWMDGPNSPAPKTSVLIALRRIGLTHIRLPVPAELVMNRFTPDRDIEAQLGLVARTLTTLNSLGFAVSIDLHPGDDFRKLHRDDPAAALNAAKDAWQKLAMIIRPFSPKRVYAELLNEPDVTAEIWQSHVIELAALVRRLLPETLLIVGPVNWQRADSLPQFVPLDDLNVMYAIHVYDPMVFTHQGHWDLTDPLHSIRGLPYPVSAADPKVRFIRRQLATSSASALRDLDAAIAETEKGDLLKTSLEPAVKWQQQYRRPLIVNEFGVLKAEAPPESRARWIGAVVENAERNCWGWAHWELQQGFGLVDAKTDKIDSHVIDALMRKP